MGYNAQLREFKDGEAWSVTEYDNNGEVTATWLAVVGPKYAEQADKDTVLMGFWQ